MYDIKISTIIVNMMRVIINSVKILPLKILASSREVTSFSLNIGIKTADNAPSPNILLNKLGNLKATLTQSASADVPKVAAIKNSLARPKNLDKRVKNATMIPDLKSMFCKYTLT